MKFLVAILIAVPAMFAMTVVYVAALLAAARRLQGTPKLALFMIMNGTYTAAVWLLLGWFSDFPDRPLFSLALGATAMPPSFYYVMRVRIQDLQRAGYFLK